MAQEHAIDINTLSPRGLLILETAQKLFFHHGFDETSLAMIIEKTGGSRRSIYKEFGNKQGLLIAVIHRQVKKQADTLTLINRQLEAREALIQVCFKFVQGMLSVELMSLFRLVIQQTVKYPELGEIVYKHGPMAGILPLVDYLTWLTTQNILKIDDCRFRAQMLIDMAKGPLQTHSLLLPNKMTSDDEIIFQVTQAVDAFLHAHRI